MFSFTYLCCTLLLMVLSASAYGKTAEAYQSSFPFGSTHSQIQLTEEYRRIHIFDGHYVRQHELEFVTMQIRNRDQNVVEYHLGEAVCDMPLGSPFAKKNNADFITSSDVQITVSFTECTSRSCCLVIRCVPGDQACSATVSLNAINKEYVASTVLSTPLPSPDNYVTEPRVRKLQASQSPTSTKSASRTNAPIPSSTPSASPLVSRIPTGVNFGRRVRECDVSEHVAQMQFQDVSTFKCSHRDLLSGAMWYSLYNTMNSRVSVYLTYGEHCEDPTATSFSYDMKHSVRNSLRSINIDGGQCSWYNKDANAPWKCCIHVRCEAIGGCPAMRSNLQVYLLPDFHVADFASLSLYSALPAAVASAIVVAVIFTAYSATMRNMFPGTADLDTVLAAIKISANGAGGGNGAGNGGQSPRSNSITAPRKGSQTAKQYPSEMHHTHARQRRSLHPQQAYPHEDHPHHNGRSYSPMHFAGDPIAMDMASVENSQQDMPHPPPYRIANYPHGRPDEGAFSDISYSDSFGSLPELLPGEVHEQDMHHNPKYAHDPKYHDRMAGFQTPRSPLPEGFPPEKVHRPSYWNGQPQHQQHQYQQQHPYHPEFSPEVRSPAQPPLPPIRANSPRPGSPRTQAQRARSPRPQTTRAPGSPRSPSPRSPSPRDPAPQSQYYY